MFSNLSNLDSNSFHARWIKGYNSSEYQEMTIWLKNYVDNIEVQLTDEMKINMKRIFYLSINSKEPSLIILSCVSYIVDVTGNRTCAAVLYHPK